MRIFICILILSQLLLAGNISLKNADSLVTWYTSDSVYTTKFLGNVFVEHDDIDIRSTEMNYVKVRDYLILQKDVRISKESGEYFFSDSTRYFKETKMITAEGSILAGFTQDSLKIYGDSLLYHMDDSKKYGWIWHRPVAMKIKKIDTLKLIGDSIYINRKDSVLKSISNVFIGGKKSRILSDSAIYYYSKDSIDILGNRPRVYTAKDTLIGDFIYGKFRESSSDIKRVDIKGDVDIRSSNKDKTEINYVYGDMVNAFFYENETQNIDIVYVKGSPKGMIVKRVPQDTVFYSADSMAVNFNDSQSVKEIFLIGNSKYVMKKKKNKDNDTLEGDRIVIYFEKSQPVLAKVINHAKLENFSNDAKGNTINQVSGDSIDVNFVKGEIDNIDFRGRIEGKIISIPR